MLPKLTQLDQIRRLNWTGTPGNRVEYVYYTGIEPENPSGTTGNVKQIVYRDGLNNTVLTINYEYDAQDNVILEYSQK